MNPGRNDEGGAGSPNLGSHRIEVIPPVPEKRRAPAFERAIGRQAGRVRNGGLRLFSAAPKEGALHREAK
jgi:hypothetical protein